MMHVRLGDSMLRFIAIAVILLTGTIVSADTAAAQWNESWVYAKPSPGIAESESAVYLGYESLDYLMVGVRCGSDGPVVGFALGGGAIANTPDPVMTVTLQFDDSMPWEPELMVVGHRQMKSVVMPYTLVDRFVRAALPANELTITMARRSDGYSVTYTIPLKGFTRSYRQLSCSR